MPPHANCCVNTIAAILGFCADQPFHHDDHVFAKPPFNDGDPLRKDDVG